jgi:hypothetical protein
MAIAIILILIFGSAFILQKVLSDSSQELLEYIIEVENNTENDEWEKALIALKLAEKDWKITRKYWCMLIDHIEIDNVSNSMSKLPRLIQYKEKTLVLAEISTLKDFIKHIPVRFSCCIENIL